MVWGMISSYGVGTIIRFHCNINAIYKELLRQHVPLYLQLKLQYLCKKNAPSHTAKTELNFLEEEGITKPLYETLGNVWKIIGEKAQNRNPQNIDDLWSFLKEKWESITFCKNKAHVVEEAIVVVSHRPNQEHNQR